MGIMEDITGGVQSGINSVISAGENSLSNISTTTALIGAGVGGLVVGGGVGALVGSSLRKKTKKVKHKSSRSGRARDRRFKSKQKHEQRYKRKRKYKVYGKKGYINPKKSKSSSRKGVHYTKKGQPYILLRSGKARFIKKRSKK
jgi:hypothetical protein